MNIKIIRTATLTFIISLVSCQSSAADSACASLVSDISFERLNTDIVLSTPNNKSDFSTQDDLSIYADNYSESVLESAPDKDLKMYLWNNTAWVEIENKLDYLSRVDRFGVKSPMDPGAHTYHFFYDTSAIKTPTKFCVILRAIKDPENAHVNIASYVEIEVSP